MTRAIVVATTLLAASLWLSSSHAQEPSKAASSQQAAMQEYMKYMMPSERHQVFAKMAGKWQGKMKLWNGENPSQPPSESSDESEAKLQHGGRFLLEESKGTIMGMPSQRTSLIGYDNHKKVYTQVFYSNMATATNIAQGTLDASGKVLTLFGEFDDPSGKYKFKNVIRLQSDDVHIFESYRIRPDGTEHRAIEGVFTRVK